MSYQFNYASKPVNQALPAGWEAKYDPTNRKWFYINHFTKTTQWNDPRLTMQQPARSIRVQPSPQPQRPATPQEKHVPFTTSFIDAEPDKLKDILENYGVDSELVKSLLRTHMNNVSAVESALKDMGFKKKVKNPAVKRMDVDSSNAEMLVVQYGVSPSVAQSMLRTHQNNMSSAASALSDLGYRKKGDANTEFIQKLKNEFRSAPLNTIKSQLIKTHNSVQGTRLALEAMGYKREVFSEPPVPKPSSTEYKRSEPKDVKPAVSKTTQKKPKAKPAKPKVDVEKAKRDLKRKFPDLDATTIALCLKVAQNDVEMATKILEAKVSDDKPVTSSRSHVDEYKPVETEEPREFAPVKFGEEEPIASFNVTIPTFSLAVPTFSDTPAPAPSQTPAPAARVKERYTPVKKIYKQKKPSPGGYTSSLRNEPIGPNPDFYKGPDSSLLLNTYAERIGPNRSNRNGPLKSNRCGPDQRNRVGPAHLAVGPAAIEV